MPLGVPHNKYPVRPQGSNLLAGLEDEQEEQGKKRVEMEDRFDEYGRRISTAKTVEEALQEERDETARTDAQREHDSKREGGPCGGKT